LQDLDEKAAAVAAVQAQASGLVAKLSEAEAALQRNTEVRGLWTLLHAVGMYLCTSCGLPTLSWVLMVHWQHMRIDSATQSRSAPWLCSNLNVSIQANSALSMVEREGFEAQLAAARQAAEDAHLSTAAVSAHILHDPHAVDIGMWPGFRFISCRK
jgi:hypothetical protein